jgi:hypothetical protein
MGFSVTQSQLLSAPPYVLAACFVCLLAWFSDRQHLRGPIIAALQIITAVGMIITVYGGSNGARYFGAFLSELAHMTTTDQD